MKNAIRNICMILSILIVTASITSCKKYETRKYRGKYYFTAKQGFWMASYSKDTTTVYYGSISDDPSGKVIVNFSPVFTLDKYYGYSFSGILFLNVDADGKPTGSSGYNWSTKVSFYNNGDVEITDGGGPNGLQFSSEIHGKRL